LIGAIYAKTLSSTPGDYFFATHTTGFGNFMNRTSTTILFAVPESGVVKSFTGPEGSNYETYDVSIARRSPLGDATARCSVGTCSGIIDYMCDDWATIKYENDGKGWRVYARGSRVGDMEGEVNLSKCTGTTGTLMSIQEGDISFVRNSPTADGVEWSYIQSASQGYIDGIAFVNESALRGNTQWYVYGDRGKFATNMSFVKMNQSTYKEFISYSCDGEDNTTALLYGIDIFNWEALVLVMFIVAIIVALTKF
jgi:hypothetical protein